ncbi:hypothetical protein, partial [Chlorobaculum thiosulfatiphilum]|uniref:hypothetical protein n=1 Tax=Chlorobaculum thiosulfatiphilum TaxID=115852 RepID=UPI001B87773E
AANSTWLSNHDGTAEALTHDILRRTYFFEVIIVQRSPQTDSATAQVMIKPQITAIINSLYSGSNRSDEELRVPAGECANGRMAKQGVIAGSFGITDNLR